MQHSKWSELYLHGVIYVYRSEECAGQSSPHLVPTEGGASEQPHAPPTSITALIIGGSFPPDVQ